MMEMSMSSNMASAMGRALARNWSDASTLAFHALDDVSGSFSADVIVGTGNIAEARTSTIYLPDDSNVYQSYGSTVPGEYYAGGKWWLYGAPAATNEITYSRDLTNAAWASSNITTTYDQVGLTGSANSASLLNDSNSGAFGLASETISIANDSNSHVFRVFVKKDADTTRFPEFQLQLKGGTTEQRYDVQINTSTGSTTVRTAATGAVNEVRDTGNYWEYLAEVPNNSTGNVNGVVNIFPAVTTTLGSIETSATGSCIIGNVELHLNKAIAEVRGSSPIFTSGSTVTVNTTDLSFDASNHDDTEGAWYCEIYNLNITNSINVGIIGLGGQGRLFNTAFATISAYDGTSNANGSISYANDTAYRLGLAYGGSDKRTNVDGVWGTSVAYDGAWNNTIGAIAALKNNTFVSSISVPTLLRDVRRYNEDYTTAQATIDGLMA